MADVHTAEQRSRNMAAIRSKDTKPEVRVRQFLHSLGYRFRLHRKDLPGKPDIVLPKHKIAIFVHGCFWHCHGGRYRPIPQFDIDHYLLDFALLRPNGRKLNIEIDGEKYHRDWDGELIRKDQLRNLRLIEMGWDVLRLWVYEVRDNLPGCIMRVKRWAEEADALPGMVSGSQLQQN